VSRGVEETKAKVRRATLEKLNCIVAVKEASRLASAAGMLPAGDTEAGFIWEELSIARRKLSQVEGELASAKEELRIREKLESRPQLVAKLEQARALAAKRDALADAVHRALGAFADALAQLDRVSGELYAVARDARARGVGATGDPLHELHSASRLLPALSSCVARTSYSKAVKRPLLHRSEDFAETERAVSAKIISQLQRELESLDTLAEKLSQEVA
jgi:hypothetical protein